MGTAELILISVLTLNIWGLPRAGFKVLSPLREERVKELCQKLKKAAATPEGWDVVFLQEVWVKEDREILSKCGYSESVDLNEKDRLLDHGLMILSRYPLSASTRLTYPALRFDSESGENGEFFARKSAIAAKLSHPKAGELWVSNTHLVSFYDEESRDKFYDSRRLQFTLFANWSKQLAGKLPLIVGGDWNFGPHNKGLWVEKENLFSGFVSAREGEKICTISKSNTFQSEDLGKLDHIMASTHFVSVRGGLAMEEPVRDSNQNEFHISDHFGWTEVFGLPLKTPFQ